MSAIEIGPLGWAFLGLHAAAIPWLAWRSRRAFEEDVPWPPRARLLTALIVQQLALCGFAVAVALAHGFDPLPLGPVAAPPALAAAALFAAALGLALAGWRRASARYRRRRLCILPRSRAEHALWAGVSLAAGIGEEVSYRAVLFTLLASLSGSQLAAALLSSALFALAHAAQGISAVWIVFPFALGLQGLVAWSGGLALAIAVHAAYDLTAGFALARSAREPVTGGPADGAAV